MSDIKFVGEDIHVEGNVQRVTCFDIELDNAGRRKNASGRRRAFVHDFGDGLTLNWANDYPGGVTINGEVRMPNGATVGALAGTALKCSHHTLHLDHAARRSAALAAPAKRKGKAPTANLAIAATAVSSVALAGHTVVNVPGLRPTQRRALMHDATDGLTINVNADYPGGVTIRGAVKLPETLLVKNQDLLQLIVDLQAKVSALEARVAVLEAAAPAPGG
jgi:hypothetical protein